LKYIKVCSEYVRFLHEGVTNFVHPSKNFNNLIGITENTLMEDIFDSQSSIEG